MKYNFLLLSIALLVSASTKAQGNLQFNQIKRSLYTGSALAFSNTTAGSITVPANKVWKIESGSVTEANNPNQYLSLHVDSQVLFSYLYGPFASPPIWLPAGTYTVQVNNSFSSAFSYNAAISSIEYNVVQ